MSISLSIFDWEIEFFRFSAIKVAHTMIFKLNHNEISLSTFESIINLLVAFNNTLKDQ